MSDNLIQMEKVYKKTSSNLTMCFPQKCASRTDGCNKHNTYEGGFSSCQISVIEQFGSIQIAIKKLYSSTKRVNIDGTHTLRSV